MRILAIDIGSSGVRAVVLKSPKAKNVEKESYVTTYENNRAEVDADDLLAALHKVCTQAKPSKVDAIAIAGMSQSWVAMDRNGEAITPVVTHQDRRSVDVANEILEEFGQATLLRKVGNLPFPGSISSTTAAWFTRHAKSRMRRCALVGHVTTLLIRRLTGQAVVDPGNAAFMGMMNINRLKGWDTAVAKFVGIDEACLPEVKDSDTIAGTLTPEGAKFTGAKEGTPVLSSIVDGSGGMLLVESLAGGLKNGQMLNVSGSTDVLAVLSDKPRPHRNLLTRGLGVGKWWLAVSTLASAGSTLKWARKVLYADVDEPVFDKAIKQAADACAIDRDASNGVTFDLNLAGDRMSMEQRRGGFAGLNLGSTREDMMCAIVEAIAQASAARLKTLQHVCPTLRKDVYAGGGSNKVLRNVLRRDWPARFNYEHLKDTTLRGIWSLAERWAEKG